MSAAEINAFMARELISLNDLARVIDRSCRLRLHDSPLTQIPVYRDAISSNIRIRIATSRKCLAIKKRIFDRVALCIILLHAIYAYARSCIYSYLSLKNALYQVSVL